MRNSIAVCFLRKLSTKEIEGLESFVQNPCFNVNKDVIQLFKYLERFAPHFDDESLNAENAFKAIYPGKIFNKATLNGLMNKLFSVIKKFISALQNTSNQVEVEINTLIFCKKRYSERFEKQLNRIRHLLDKKEKGRMLYHYIATLEHESCEYQAVNEKHVNYTAFSEALDKFYWFSKLPLFAEMLNYKLITANNGYSLSELDIYLRFVEEAGYTQVPLIQLWHYLINVFKNIIDKVPVTLEDYHKFKDLFFENIDDLHTNDKRNLCIYLRNIIRFSSFEDADYYREEFEIDRFSLEKGLIFFYNYLRELSVKNIVNSAIRVGEIQWAKEFLDKYKDLFRRRFAADLLAYCKAVINFYEGKYDEARALFTSIKEYNNVFFEIEKRIKLVQIYYETEEVDLLDGEINKLRVYIHRKQDDIGDMFAQSYLNFAKYIKKISGIIRRDIDKITELETEISKIPVRLLFEKKWLLDKLEELKR